ncbi:MAG: BTAD domain-containing putative transcriptional regulator [Ilumatobacteraceae bacterium]
MAVLSVSVLGTVRVARDGLDEPIGSRRQRALLAALAVRHPRAVAVDDLVDAVWGDDPPNGAKATLQTYVSRLRSTLGDDAITHEPAGYRLGLDAVVDADEARNALTSARARLGAEPAAAAEIARAALDRWHGTALAELADSEWFAPVAAGLQGAHDQLRDTLAEALVESGRALEAIDVLEQAVLAQPFHERAQLLLARALALSGRPTDALRAADRYRRTLRDETGLDPGPGLAELESAILTGEAASPSQPTRRNVAPAPQDLPTLRLPRPGRLVGREAELTVLADALRTSRLVTVLGTGGVGKTRLVAELLATSHDTPAAVVELAAVDDEQVVAAVAAAIRYRAGRADAEALVDAIGNDTTLLVLDNAEHVMAAVRATVRTLLDACPNLRVLATSRTRLGLPDERLVALQPLPTSGDRPASIELFADCLRRAQPHGDIDLGGDDVRVLCERLDGLPLALEIAAARAAVLGVGALAERLATSNELMSIPAEAGGGRHTSLEALVGWSYDLLGPPARRLLAALSIVDSEFDLTVAERMAADLLDEPVAPAFERLVDTCLVALGTAPGRFRMLDTIRRFASDRLVSNGDRAAVQRAHGRWITIEAAQLDALSTGPDEPLLSERIDRLRGDVRGAIARAADGGDVATLVSVSHHMMGALMYRPDADIARQVLDAALRPNVRGADGEALLLAAGSRAGWLLGDVTTAATLAAHAVAIAPTGVAGAAARGRAHHSLGVVALYAGRFDEAEVHFRHVADDPESTVGDRVDALAGAALSASYGGATDRAAAHSRQHRAMAEASSRPSALAFADYVDGERALAHGEAEVALDLLRAAADRAWSVGATFVWGLSSTVLAATLVRRSDHDAAALELPTLLRRWRRTATWPQIWMSMRLVAEVLAAKDHAMAAVTVLAAADRDPAAPSLGERDRERLAQLRLRLETDLGADAAALAHARAEVLDRRQVLDMAIDTLDSLHS